MHVWSDKFAYSKFARKACVHTEAAAAKVVQFMSLVSYSSSVNRDLVEGALSFANFSTRQCRTHRNLRTYPCTHTAHEKSFNNSVVNALTRYIGVNVTYKFQQCMFLRYSRRHFVMAVSWSVTMTTPATFDSYSAAGSIRRNRAKTSRAQIRIHCHETSLRQEGMETS